MSPLWKSKEERREGGEGGREVGEGWERRKKGKGGTFLLKRQLKLEMEVF